MNRPVLEQVTLQDGESANLVSENIEQLKAIFPDAFSEGGVNFDTLRQLLGDAGVIDEGEEKYGMNWHGKKRARQIALTPSIGTLLPCPKESVDWEKTQNLFIEGDNLEVLKLLQKSYAGKIKMIYIDPPYNTGKEFIYPDRFQDDLDTYLKYTGQIDEEGLKLSSNTETSGRMHTNWLNMIYPRLKLAKNLLTSDGVLLVSIDDNEISNLREICDEIFGEENFVAQFVWKSRKFTDARSLNNVSTDHEYIVAYGKRETVALRGRERDESKYTNTDNDPRGPWMSRSMLGLATKDQRPNLHYEIVDPETGAAYMPPSNTGWRYSSDRMAKLIEEKCVLFPKKTDGRPREKKFRSDIQGDYTSIPSIIDGIHTSDGTQALREIFGSQIFDFPKPYQLIEKLTEQCAADNDIVLDFFAGSCATAEAVIRHNVNSGSNISYIMVQLPEPCEKDSEAYKAGFSNIAEIGKERIRRVSSSIKKESQIFSGDLGFKAFKLARSNIKIWNPDRTDLEQTLISHQEHLLEGRTEQDVLYELLIKRGIDLAVPIESKNVVGKNIFSIGYGVLFACLDTKISSSDIESIAQGILEWHEELTPVSDTHVFFRDSAFSDDIAKTNMAAILEQNGITHVRSL